MKLLLVCSISLEIQLFAKRDQEFKPKYLFLMTFSPEIWIYAAMPPIDYFLTIPNQFALKLGRYHLRRLKLLRGDQVDFYQWENRKGLK